jgi:hypothetical protein
MEECTVTDYIYLPEHENDDLPHPHLASPEVLKRWAGDDDESTRYWLAWYPGALWFGIDEDKDGGWQILLKTARDRDEKEAAIQARSSNWWLNQLPTREEMEICFDYVRSHPSPWLSEALRGADVLAAEDAHAPSIDRVIDDLGRGLVKDTDKGRLRHAIDTAPSTPTEPAAGPKTAKPLPERALRVTATANTDVRSYR